MEAWNRIWKKILVWNWIWNGRFWLWNENGMKENYQYRIWKNYLPWLKCSYLRSFSPDTCQEESSECRVQENERLFIGKSRAVIGWKRTIEKASLVYIVQSLSCIRNLFVGRGRGKKFWLKWLQEQIDEKVSGLAQQKKTCCHHNDFQSRFFIFAQGRSPFHLSALEATLIKTSNPALCRQKEFVYSLKIVH